MKSILLLSCVALLAGCAGPEAYRDGYGSPGNYGYGGPIGWGMPGGQPPAPSYISETEFEQLTTQINDFRAKREEMRLDQMRQPDPYVRAQRQQTIDQLTQAIIPLERRLMAAGRPLPR
ncbi:MAG: hypothetical protein Q8K31_08655 [Burkholderiaceae bacterium]|nr:hypothetical protein [Burkholderiaceae bacterium]MDO9088942.1 hypothetical protein [Burkholderiaceae bacterium]MDP1969240.1 hypothetical protein [Burkholderiaceae bacterium]